MTVPGYVIAGAALLLAWRAASAGVIGNDRLVRVRSALWTRTLAVQDVTAVSAEVIDHNFIPVWAPVIEVVSWRRPVRVRALAGYSRSDRIPNRRVSAAVDRIRATYGISDPLDTV